MWRKTAGIAHTKLGPGPGVPNLHREVRGGNEEAHGRGGEGTELRHGYFSFNIVTTVAFSKRDGSIGGFGPSSSSLPSDLRTSRTLLSPGVDGGHRNQPTDGTANLGGGYGATPLVEEGIASFRKSPIRIHLMLQTFRSNSKC